MEFNFEKNTVNVFSKTYKIDYVINKLSSLSGYQIHGFFSSRNVLIPRRLNCLALYSVINKKLRYINSNTFSKDSFERLKYYEYFSEYQLCNLYKDIATYDDFLEYRKNLFKIILYNYLALNFKDGEIQYLINLKKLQMESVEQYFESISCSCCEQENTFDGQDADVLYETLEYSASNYDIYAIGEKYGIKLPSRLKKDELLGYIYWQLEKTNKMDLAVSEEINNMTVNELTDFAKNNMIDMSVNLTKPELVKYFFYVLSKYQIPRLTVKRLVVLEEFEPIKFVVKLENASQFKTENPKKVLFFEGESLDKDSLMFESELSSIYTDVKEDEKNIIDEEPEVKTYELPKKEIKVVVVNQVSKDDLTALKYSTIKGVDYKKTKNSLKNDKTNIDVKNETPIILEAAKNEELENPEVSNEILVGEDKVAFDAKEETLVLTPEVEEEKLVIETVSNEVVEEVVENESNVSTKVVEEEKIMPTFDLPEVDDYEEYDSLLEENNLYHQTQNKKKGKFKSLIKKLLLITLLLGVAVVVYVLVKEYLI